MIIETLSWGSIDISEEQIYHFLKGIPGFEGETKFVLIHGEEGPFSYLQSTEDKSVSFLVADPFVFYPNYEFELPDAEAEELGIQEEVLVRCVVTLKDPVEESTINLLAPIVLNPVTFRGKQVVLNKTNYQTRQSLWNNQDNSIEVQKDGE
ncbi:flagellar assembly protein FliW [Paenibacillus zeisoli]|uniref:Flagellar assembly factor FliW n=1 Tax=Paenibacillus zeisoli TaxID=2496267 RepID=A0A3S1B6U3_9BACL|nr:flagellar assembly protein FliW [Paenibacillus zeisoli]RUT33274.1 flagellar assembly protein FliW [Paenibacillus zeisoli]